MRKFKKTMKKVLTISIIFLLFFIFSFLIFGYLVNKFTPSVDIQIAGEEPSVSQESSSIDERLKQIQNDDNGEIQTEKPEETFQNKDEHEETIDEEVTNDEDVLKQQDTKETKPETKKAPVPKQSDITNHVSVAPKVSVKIFAGYYVTLEQAVAAQENIKEHYPSLSPFVKEVNEYYIVQIGTFSNSESAIDVYNSLKNMNYPVKMKSE